MPTTRGRGGDGVARDDKSEATRSNRSASKASPTKSPSTAIKQGKNTKCDDEETGTTNKVSSERRTGRYIHIFGSVIYTHEGCPRKLCTSGIFQIVLRIKFSSPS